MKYFVVWIFALPCIMLGIAGLSVHESGEAFQFFLLAGILIKISLENK